MKKRKEKACEKDFYQPEADPQGSYTGIPEEPEEKPVQDADDL